LYDEWEDFLFPVEKRKYFFFVEELAYHLLHELWLFSAKNGKEKIIYVLSSIIVVKRESFCLLILDDFYLIDAQLAELLDLIEF